VHLLFFELGDFRLYPLPFSGRTRDLTFADVEVIPCRKKATTEPAATLNPASYSSPSPCHRDIAGKQLRSAESSRAQPKTLLTFPKSTA
jgi:hypothetical protein